jgi:hypothetical protein
MWLLCGTLERAGPAFIKWGQWAATRPDMFPPDMCTELERLQTKAPAHSARFSIAAVEAAFGAPIDQMFDSFEEDPVASGSIAQVRPSTSFSKIVKEHPKSPARIHTFTHLHTGIMRHQQMFLFPRMNVSAVAQFSHCSHRSCLPEI